MGPNAKWQSNKTFWWTWFCCCIPLLGFWAYGLFDLDEGFYAAVVGEMNRRGEWITPYFNGAPWFEKPILLYWVAKPSVLAFGEDFGPRLPSVLATAGLYLLCGAWVRRRWNSFSAVVVMAVVASSLLVVAVGRMMLADALLALTLTAAFLSFWESLVGDWRWRWLTAACLGLSVLAKGPVGCAFFVLLAVWTYIIEPELRPAFRRGWTIGVLIFLIVVGSWYVPAYLTNGEVFVQKFLIEQNLERFSGGDRAHTLDDWRGRIFFIPVLLVGMFPWSLLIPAAWPRRGRTALPELRFLAAWAVIVFAFFSISGSKLVHYILPAVIPLCMLVGVWLAATRPRFLGWIVGVWLAAVAFLAVGGSWLYYERWDREAHRELRTYARLINQQPGTTVMYQFSRRSPDRGTGGVELQETSHPSLEFYLNQPPQEAETVDELIAMRPRYLLTRKQRLRDADLVRLRQSGIYLRPVGPSGDVYVLFERH